MVAGEVVIWIVGVCAHNPRCRRARMVVAPAPTLHCALPQAMEKLEAPAPFVPPPLPEDDMDATLLELTKRCQDGFR